MEISVVDPCKMGDGMGAYMVYKVKTKVGAVLFTMYITGRRKKEMFNLMTHILFTVIWCQIYGKGPFR